MCVTDYLKFETVTNINIERKDDIVMPALHICYEFKRDIFIYRITFEKKQIYYADLAFEIKYGKSKCALINTGRNLTGHKVPLLTAGNKGQEYGIKISFYMPVTDTIFLNIGKNDILPSTKDLHSLTISAGTSNFVSVSKIKDKNLGEPFSNCKKDLSSLKGFKSKPFEATFNRSGFTYSYENCYETCVCMALAPENECTCTGIYETNYDRECMSVGSFNQGAIAFNKTNCYHLCPIECDHEYYTNILTSLPTERSSFSKNKVIFSDYFKQLSNITPEFNISRVSSLFVYFDDFRIMQLKELEKISTVDLISSIGGCLGLFLGLSLLSIMEVIDIFIELINFMHQSVRTNIIKSIE